MKTNQMRALLAVGMMAAVLALAQPVSAQSESWTVLPLTSRGMDEGIAETFRDLLQNELSTRNGASFSAGGQACQDAPCAVASGAKLGAGVAVFGSMNALGSKIIVSVTVVDVASGQILSNQKMKVDQVEDLDSAAVRIAEAIVTGSTTKETAELGNITEEESRPERRRMGKSGLGLRVGGVAPLSDGYADGVPGVLIEASYWYETSSFAIEPRIGARFSADNDGGNYLELPMDVGAYYIIGQSDFAPFVGGGGGLHAKAGILLFRTFTMRVAISADYNISFVEVNGNANPQSLTAGIGVYF
jgi:TolB-like protein